MGDEELPEIVVPNDAVAIRGSAVARPGGAVDYTTGLPPGRLWIVGTDHDGSVVVWEIPQPDDASIEVDHDIEPVHAWGYAEPIKLVHRAVTTTWRIVTTRPYSMRIWPKGAWRPQ